MKTSKKIVIVIILISLLNIIPSFTRMKSLDQTQEHLSLIIQSNLDEQEGISQLAYYLQRTKSNLRELLLESSYRSPKKEVGHAREVVLNSLSQLEANLILLRKGTIKGKEFRSDSEKRESDDEMKMVKEISVNLEKFINNTHDILEVTEKPGDAKFYVALFVNNVEPLSRVLQEQIDEFKIDEFNEVRHELESVALHFQNIRKTLTIISVLTLTLSILFGVLLARNITNLKKE